MKWPLLILGVLLAAWVLTLPSLMSWKVAGLPHCPFCIIPAFLRNTWLRLTIQILDCVLALSCLCYLSKWSLEVDGVWFIHWKAPFGICGFKTEAHQLSLRLHLGAGTKEALISFPNSSSCHLMSSYSLSGTRPSSIIFCNRPLRSALWPSFYRGENYRLERF